MLETALMAFMLGAQVVGQQPSPTYRVERQPVAGGAELVTLFENVRSAGASRPTVEVPLLTVLRDTLGDSDQENDRLRYAWILTSTHPTPLQRAASALSFVRFRTGSQPHRDQVPKPVLDLASPAKSVWAKLLGNSFQALQLDPMGAPIRTSTRTYRGNSSDYRKLQVFRAASALGGLEREPGTQNVLQTSDLRAVYSRLRLSDFTFGGLVREENLARFYDKENSRIEEARGHNWELLRQRAEFCGLYFEPLALPGATPAEAMLWIARSDLSERADQRFERQFLNISNPWTDDRLLNWTGYSEVRYFDADNRPVPRDTPGARAVDMIPLALYSLDYPKVPLLLADFRDTFKPKRRELFQHGTSTILTGVLGITRVGNWSYMAANTTWTFVRRRHGATNDRSARLRAYSEAREFLAVDASLNPELKSELVRRLDHLAVNPLENGWMTEANVARQQYAALLQYAQSPNGLAARLDRDRRKELEAYSRSRPMRILAGLGRWFTGGPRFDPEKPDLILRAELDSRRRAATHVRSLEQLLASSPRPDVVRDESQIRRSIEALSVGPDVSPRASRLIAEVYARSGDWGLRIACLRALQRLDIEEARNELWRLSQDPNSTETWRSLCLLYWKGETASGDAGAFGQQ